MSKAKRPTSQAKRQADGVVAALAELYPDATCALVHADPYELIVATILSAQCTDARVNLVTPALFARYPNAIELARADQSELEEIIRSTGFYRAKARNLLGMANRVVQEYGGEIPTDLDDLTSLPGVGRKTANVVLGTAFGIASGIVVDTHVKRLAKRLGLTKATSPEHVERDLIQLVPESGWVDFSHRLIQHGRRVCKAIRPLCNQCPLESICPRVGVKIAGAGPRA